MIVFLGKYYCPWTVVNCE